MRTPAARLAHRGASALQAAGALALAVVSLALLAPSSASAASSLVFSSADFATLGLRPAPATAASARAQLVAGLPGGLAASLHGALIQASAATTSGQRLDSSAFVLRSSSLAGRVLNGWRKAHSAAAVAIGSGGAVADVPSGAQTAVSVLWRNAARLGLIVLTTTQPASSARDSAVSYAMLAEAFLSTPLPTTA